MSAWDIPTVSAFAQDRQFCAAPQTHRGQEPEVIRSRPTRYTPTGNPRGRVSTLDAAALRDYREAGHSWAQVAEHFGRSKYHANALVCAKFGPTSFGAKRGPVLNASSLRQRMRTVLRRIEKPGKMASEKPARQGVATLPKSETSACRSFFHWCLDCVCLQDT